MKKTKLCLLLVASLGLVACQSAPVLKVDTSLQQLIDRADIDTIMAPSNSLYSLGVFHQATQQLAIAANANQKDKVNSLLYFFRGFSYYGDSDAFFP